MCNQWLHFLSAQVAWRIVILSSEMIAWKNMLALTRTNTCTNPYYIHHRTHMQPPAQLGCLCSFYQATGLLLGFYYGSSRLGFLGRTRLPLLLLLILLALLLTLILQLLLVQATQSGSRPFLSSCTDALAHNELTRRCCELMI